LKSEEETQRIIENGVLLVEENIFSIKFLPKLRGFVNACMSLSTEKIQELVEKIAALENGNS